MLYWDKRIDFKLKEKEAIDFYLQYGEYINYYIRFPDKLDSNYVPYFVSFLQYLDKAIAKSTINLFCFREICYSQKVEHKPTLFRGLSGEFASDLVKAVENGMDLIEDLAYVSFTYDKETALSHANKYKNGIRVILVKDCYPFEKVLFIAGKEFEIIYPRDTKWKVLDIESKERDDGTIAFIYVERV